MASLQVLRSVTNSVHCWKMLSNGPLMMARTPSLVPCVQKLRWLTLDSVASGVSLARVNSLATSPIVNHQRSLLHTSASASAWEDHNKTVYPPQKPGEPRRPAVSNNNFNIKNLTSKFELELWKVELELELQVQLQLQSSSSNVKFWQLKLR